MYAAPTAAGHPHREDIMPHRSYVSLLTLIALTVAAPAAPPAVHAQVPVAIPNSPAGTLLKQWLEVFNRGDSAALDVFSRAHYPRVTAQMQMQDQRVTGGVELLRIISAEPSHITFAARARERPLGLRGNIELMDGDPSQIKSLAMQPRPAP
jgi:hypothetical protein